MEKDALRRASTTLTELEDVAELQELVRRGCEAVVPPHYHCRRGVGCDLLATDAILQLSVVSLPLPNPGSSEDALSVCWRRILCPSHFSLLQLHVLIQAAFRLGDGGSHSFRHHRASSDGGLSVAFEVVDFGSRDSLLLDASDGAGVAFVEHSSPTRWNHFGSHIGCPDLFAIPPTPLLDERAFRVGDVLHHDSPDLWYEYSCCCRRGRSLASLGVRVQLLGSRSADADKDFPSRSALRARCPSCVGGRGEAVWESRKLANRGDSAVVLCGWSLRASGARERQCNSDLHETFRDVSLSYLKCPMCRYRGRFCSLKSGRCSGVCCAYCVHHALCRKQGCIALEQAKSKCAKVIRELQDSRARFLAHTNKEAGGLDVGYS